MYCTVLLPAISKVSVWRAGAQDPSSARPKKVLKSWRERETGIIEWNWNESNRIEWITSYDVLGYYRRPISIFYRRPISKRTSSSSLFLFLRIHCSPCGHCFYKDRSRFVQHMEPIRAVQSRTHNKIRFQYFWYNAQAMPFQLSSFPPIIDSNSVDTQAMLFQLRIFSLIIYMYIHNIYLQNPNIFPLRYPISETDIVPADCLRIVIVDRYRAGNEPQERHHWFGSKW